MRLVLAAACVLSFSSAAFAQQGTAPAPAATPAATGNHYTTTDTDIGTLLDDPAARAVLQQNLPQLLANDQINMARGMTLRAIQAYAGDMITDTKLATIDQQLAALPPHN